MTILALPFLSLLAITSAANPKLLQTRQSTCINPVSDQELIVRHPSTFPHAATNSPTQSNSNCPKKPTVDANGNCPVGEYNADSRLRQLLRSPSRIILRARSPLRRERNAKPIPPACTFATAQSITVTNTYELNFGFAFGGGGDEGGLSTAFNLGASYSYSKAVGTTRTITQPRPSTSLQYCGYWTFLPYYIT